MTLSLGLGVLETVGAIAKAAGAAILDIYKTDFDVDAKGDASPVTKADTAAEALILEAIRGKVTADFPIVAEESVAAGRIPDLGAGNAPFWLVDPLDGTKEFISRNGEFTVNIALIEAASPVLGVVHLPAKGQTFFGGREGAFLEIEDAPARMIQARPIPQDGVAALVSRSHADPETEAFLDKIPVAERVSAGSSLKFCRVAEGAADIYPRFGRTMEWDTAAGHAVLKAAGGRVVRTDGVVLSYGKPDFANPGFVALGSGPCPGFAG
jgi:3'(2'), 5'-bisphosphate nucleotidase